MAIILERQISDDDKKMILERFGRKCYATGHEISNEDDVQFDHIKAFAEKGASETDNIAPMCRDHNLKKGRLPLYDFSVKLRMDEFFNQGSALTLKDELEYFKGKKEIDSYGDNVYITTNKDEVEIEVNSRKKKYQLYKCPTTNWFYFYATFPVLAINSDDDEEEEIGLQPRYLIQDKVFQMFRHFQRNPILQPSIGRFHKNKILVFDGQHKIAAMLWSGRKDFELKVYLNPDPQLLNTTNIAAHDKFAQTRFYSSIMVSKLGSQFGKRFEEYKNLEDGQKKTESGFVRFLQVEEQLTTGEVNKRFQSFLYNSVLDPETNNIAKYVSKSNRSSAEFPLTVDMLSKSLFSNFLYRYPLDDDLASDHYLRDKEIFNLIELCNIIDAEALHNWDSRKSSRDLIQNKLFRMFRSKSIMSWAELLKDAIAAKLDIIDADEKATLFYREIVENDFLKITKIVRRLIEWNIWTSPEESDIDRILADNKSEIKKFMRNYGLTAGYLLGAPE